MKNVIELERRLAAMKAALREVKKREKQEQEKRVLEAARRAGLSMLDLEKLIESAARKGGVE